MSRPEVGLQPNIFPGSSFQSSRKKPFCNAPGDSHTGHHHGEAKNHLFLPACSGNQYQGGYPKQVITNSMMQAYVKMRGSSMGGENDPLFDWIREREEVPSTDPPSHKRRVSRMLEKIDEILTSENNSGHTPRDAVFEMQRPKIEHLEVPQNLDMKFYQEQKEKADKVLEPDSDDDEAGTPSGRISPCTFLALSKGCTRWNDDELKVYLDEEKTTRLRPPTPEVPHAWKSRDMRAYMHDWVEQEDELTGECLSPHYVVSTNPSIIFTAPGVPVENFVKSANFMGKFSRMDPLNARELRDHMYGKKFDYDEMAEDSEMFTFSEVQDAADHINSPGLGASVNATLTAHLSSQWASIAHADALSASLQRTAQQQDEKVRALELELAALRTYLVPSLRHRRAVRAAYQREALERRRREARRRRIQDRIASYMRDVQYKLDAAHLRAAEAQRRAAATAARVDDLEETIAEVLLSVGKSDVEQVYQEVLDFDVWNSVLDQGVAPPSLVGSGSGSGGDGGGGGGGGRQGVANAPAPPLRSPPMPFEVGDGYVEDSSGGRTPIHATFLGAAGFSDVDPEVVDMLERMKLDIRTKDGKKEKGKETATAVMKGEDMEKAPASDEAKDKKTVRRALKREELPIRTSSLAHYSPQKKEPDAPRLSMLSKEKKPFRGSVALETVASTKEKIQDESSIVRQVPGGKLPAAAAAAHQSFEAEELAPQPSSGKESAPPQLSKAKKLSRRLAVETETFKPQDEEVDFEESNVFPVQYPGWI